MANVAKDLAQLISQSKSNKTGPYDTQATVKRVEGNKVWVSIPGGVDETPIDKTVNCTAGDKVQVRVSGGRAWITGNASAPPTDDTTAIKARTTANEAQVLAVDAKETADAVEGIAVSASTTATTAKTIAEGVNEHFWHDSTGAHVTEVTQDEWNDPGDPNYHSGGNTLITTQGMAIRDGMTELATFGADGQAFYNDNNFSVFDIGKTEIITVTRRIEDVFEYNNELTINLELSWNCNSITGIVYYDSSYTSISITPTYTINGRVISYDTAACDTMRNSNVKYINVLYTATGRFPYITFGQRGVGEIGAYSSAEGVGVVASGIASHAEGVSTKALAYDSHSEGISTIASGENSHAEGISTQATKDGAHAEGWGTVASGVGAHSGGRGTVADQQSQTAVGTYNTKNNTNNLFVVGNGTADNARSNAFTVDSSGNIEAGGTITVGGHLSEIGHVSTQQTGTYSVPNGSTTTVPTANLTRISLNKGTWLFFAHAEFDSNATGQRILTIYDVTTSARLNHTGVNTRAVSNGTTKVQSLGLINISSAHTFTVQVYQNSGDALSADLSIQAVRIA